MLRPSCCFVEVLEILIHECLFLCVGMYGLVFLHWKRGMDIELLPNELRAMLPPLYSQEHEEDPLVICKFFTPDSNWTWYALEVRRVGTC